MFRMSLFFWGDFLVLSCTFASRCPLQSTPVTLTVFQKTRTSRRPMITQDGTMTSKPSLHLWDGVKVEDPPGEEANCGGFVPNMNLGPSVDGSTWRKVLWKIEVIQRISSVHSRRVEQWSSSVSRAGGLPPLALLFFLIRFWLRDVAGHDEQLSQIDGCWNVLRIWVVV